MNVLLVDDSKSILAGVSVALSVIPDIEVTSYLDPREAVTVCDNQVFDLVMVDYNMPGMTGVELIRALRQKANYAHVPIVMLTSESERTVRLAAIEAGATEFLAKPFDPLELKARAINLLKLRKFQLDLADQAGMLQRLVDNATAKLAAREEEIIWRLARAIEYATAARATTFPAWHRSRH